MKKFLLVAFMAVCIFAGEPIQYGAYYGNIKDKIKNYYSYTENDVSSAGMLYLYKQKKNIVDYIYETKIDHIKRGLEEAKQFAIKKKSKFFAIDNVKHQVIVNENQVIIMTDYNILAFD